MSPASRGRTLAPAEMRRVRRDPRFRAALAERNPGPTWRAEGLCLKHDPDMFFPHAAQDPRPALAVCGHCPVSGACLATALEVGDCEGVWGGTTADERRTMRGAWVVDVPDATT